MGFSTPSGLSFLSDSGGGGGAVTSVFSRIGDVTALSGDYAAFYIKLDGTSNTTASIPFAQGLSVATNQSAAIGGTGASPAYSLSFDGTDTRFQGSAINGANLYILPNQAADNVQAGNVFISGATATGDPILPNGGVMIGSSVVSRPTGVTSPQVNFLGVGGNLTVGDVAQFNANIFVGGVPAGINPGLSTISIQGQAARSIGVERAMGLVFPGQALGINAGAAKVLTTNQVGGNLTLSSGASTGTGTSSVIIQATGGGSSGTSTKAATTVLTLTTTATTFVTKLTIPSLAASSTEGDLWSDSTQKSLATFTNGIKQMLSGCLFTQTADKTVANTVTETSIVGTGVGGLTLPANFFVAGKTVRITMSGVYSTVAVTGDTVTVKIKYGSTVLASNATTALVTGGTNLAWFADALITCRSTGATGTVQVSGGIRYQIAGSAIVEDVLNNGATTTTLDTTTSSLLDVTITHGAANASNTVTSLVGSFETLN